MPHDVTIRSDAHADDEAVEHRSMGALDGLAGQELPSLRDLVERAIRQWPLLIILVAASLHSVSVASRYINADVIVSSLISTNELTLFYWGQDRLASLVPLLAWPIQEPYANLYAQMMINAAAFFTLLLMFVRFHILRLDAPSGSRRTITAVAFAATSVFALVLMTEPTMMAFVVEQQYATAFVLYLAGLTAVLRGRVALALAGGGAMVVGLMVIPSTVLFTPAVFVMSTADPVWRRRIVAFGVGLAGSLTVMLASARFGFDAGVNSSYSDFSVQRLIDNADVAARNIRDAVVAWPVVGGVVLTVIHLIVNRDRLDRTAVVASLAAPVAGLAWFLIFTSNAWVESNLYFVRYFLPVFLGLLFPLAGALTGLADVIVRAVRQVTPQASRWILATLTVGAIAVAGVATTRADRDGVAVVRNAVPSAVVAHDQEVDLVVGSYWETWPIVFAAHASGTDLQGVSFRSDAVRDQIEDAIEQPRSGTARLMCRAVNAEECAALVSGFLGTTWTVGDVVVAEPLVISVEPAP